MYAMDFVAIGSWEGSSDGVVYFQHGNAIVASSKVTTSLNTHRLDDSLFLRRWSGYFLRETIHIRCASIRSAFVEYIAGNAKSL